MKGSASGIGSQPNPDANDVRITNSMILARSLDSIQRGLAESARLERRIATGQQFQSLSEAPVAGRTVLTIDSDLRASEQFGRNAEAARSRLAVADAALNNVTNAMTRAREIALQQGSDVATPESRLAAIEEVQELRASLVQLANTRLNEAYVFGGAYTDLQPLDATGALDPTFPARGAARYEIAASTYALGAPDAGEIFIDTEVMAALDDLEAALVADDQAAIQAEGDRVRTVIASVQELVAAVGARQIRVDTAESTRSVVDQTRIEQRAVLADASLEEAITELAALQASYQGSLLATSRLLQTSLVNYLR